MVIVTITNFLIFLIGRSGKNKISEKEIAWWKQFNIKKSAIF